jgi:signal transduction histidine kinase
MEASLDRTPDDKSTAARYALAVLIGIFALLLREALSPLLGANNPYHTVWAAVVFSAWYCGLGPSILTALMSVMGVWYWFLQPFGSYPHHGAKSEISGMVGFLVLSGFIIALGEANRRSKAQSTRELAERLRSEQELKEKEWELSNAQRLARIGNWRLDPQSETVVWSQEMFRICGRDSTLGAPCFEEHSTLFTSEGWQKLRAAVEKTLHSGEEFEIELEICGCDGRQVWTLTRAEAERDAYGRVLRLRGTTQDITERKRLEDDLRRAKAEVESKVRERTAELNLANHNLKQLSARLLQMQDDERRRLARELHDSVGQMLAGIKMNIAAIQSTPLESVAARSLTDTVALVDQVTNEIRTISHLLHPPLLDEVGLSSALKWYVDGFSERSKIAIDINVDGDNSRLSKDMEIVIFRVVQECLTNVHRHSGSRTAAVRLAHEGGYVRVEVKDEGKGIPLEKQLDLGSAGKLGVGLRGMRERVAQLGGVLEVRSDENGTVVSATLPLATTAPGAASEESRRSHRVP